MKRILFSLLLSSSVWAVQAQDAKYVAAMTKNIALIDSAHIKYFANADLSLFETEANAFERIATAEKDKWQPYYFAAYCQVMEALYVKDKDKVDGWADKASLNVDKALSFSPDNSEILCLQSLVATSRISVDPMTRGLPYGKEAAVLLEKAKKLNAANPRVYMLQGQSLYYTPEQFGGSKVKAKELFETALKQFASFKPATNLDPNWGEAYTKHLLSTIK
ncbi:hypothetical protein GA0116948_111106 [Chitinophaga costaii]|uniref:Tetratricopeptide repeat-containing protein n=1 Tax=Chitinophaga costaii TaxID=1335309 RepID=A0A1C4F473_9BACT|nr:hypothetical protein [Chitinophaga costaii]PUZ22082.1 hypothetical protein DCM91_15250 [Chitinophaga costaii]SCC50602.1 hypothetical protein GA0116948_111106 [Chitinophaga costaii]